VASSIDVIGRTMSASLSTITMRGLLSAIARLRSRGSPAQAVAGILARRPFSGNPPEGQKGVAPKGSE
jgi:hypothetical protein